MMELMATLACLGVLAGLLFTAVGRARNRAAGLGCINNLREGGKLLTLFVAENREYPLRRNEIEDGSPYPNHGSSWTQSIYGTNETSEVKLRLLNCPAAKYKRGQERLHLGYNSQGILGKGGYPPVGLGVAFTGSVPRPVREAEVVNPLVVSLGDGYSGSADRVVDGSASIGRVILDPSVRDAVQPVWRRHGGMVNLAFVDGHVEAVGWRRAFVSTNDSDLIIWSRDGMPLANRFP